MANDVFCVVGGHKTFFKWHRGRRELADPVFTGKRILEGMALGASVEVDLRKHGDGGFAVLHDAGLDRETTGKGPVATARADALRQLHLRDNDGKPTDHRLMLLEDLSKLIAEGGAHDDALLQLDLKEVVETLEPADLAAFRDAIAPVQQHMILSAGDAKAIAILSEGLDSLHIGYDPCHEGRLEALYASHDFDGFVADAVAALPRAEMIYLAYPLVLFADEEGFDLIGAFHAHGKRVDTYTITVANADTAPAVERLLALKTDQITTDDPVGLSRLIEALA